MPAVGGLCGKSAPGISQEIAGRTSLSQAEGWSKAKPGGMCHGRVGDSRVPPLAGGMWEPLSSVCLTICLPLTYVHISLNRDLIILSLNTWKIPPLPFPTTPTLLHCSSHTQWSPDWCLLYQPTRVKGAPGDLKHKRKNNSPWRRSEGPAK